MTAAFDTLRFAETLKSAGIAEQEARAFTEAFSTALQEGTGQWATKQDLKDLEAATKQDLKNLEMALKQDIQELDARLNARIDHLEAKIELLDAKLEQIAYKLTLRLGGIMVLGFSVLAVLIEIL